VSNSKTGLRANRDYRLFFIGSAATYFGNAMRFIANGWLALKVTGETSSIGWIFAVAMIPNVFLAPFVGVIADRWPRKYVAVGVDVIKAMILIAMVFLYSSSNMGSVYYLYIMTFLIAFGDGVYNTVAPALVREIVPQDALLRANSRLATGNQIGAVLGAAAGGILLHFSDTIVFGINAMCYVIAAALIALIRNANVETFGSDSVKPKPKTRFFEDMGEGFRYVLQNKHIVWVYFLLLTLNFTIRAMNVLLIPFIVQVLHSDVLGFGLVDAAFAVGAIIGNVFLLRLVARYGQSRVLPAGLFALSISLLLFSQTTFVAWAIFFYMTIGISYQTRVTLVTLTQNLVKPAVIGRVQSMFFLTDVTMAFLTFMVIGYTSNMISPKWIYLVPAMLVFVAGLTAIYIFQAKAEYKVHGKPTAVSN
jgi:MFS transporter, DHA3 family, macrolide efflux protein